MGLGEDCGPASSGGATARVIEGEAGEFGDAASKIAELISESGGGRSECRVFAMIVQKEWDVQPASAAAVGCGGSG